MTLDDEQVYSIIKENPNGALIAEKRLRSDVLKMHLTGNRDLMEKFIKDIPEFMRPGMKETLLNMMRGNRDLLARTLSPREKIYTAKGGIEHYTLTESKEESFRAYLSCITDGLPLKEWIRQKAQKRFDYDPDSLVFIEVNEDNLPYPTLKGIDEIYDYKLCGRTSEYVVFEINEQQRAIYIAAGLLPNNLQKTQKVYRVVCDSWDRLVTTGNRFATQGVKIESVIPNEFGFVPGFINSDICGFEHDCFDSSLSDVVELLNSYLFASGTYALSYARQAFPKEWMQKFPCPTCEGHKEIQGEACPECEGSGYLPYIRQSDVVIADFRGDAGKGIPNPPFGIVMAPVESLQFMKDNGISLEDMIYYTIWGVYKQTPGISQKADKKGGNVSNTAFEAELNMQPQNAKRRNYSKWKDSIQTFITDTCGMYIYGSAYGGSAILSGDRYMDESPDATLDRYLKAVQAFAPKAELDSLYIEYIENKYNNNPLLYRKYLLLFYTEPFFHKSDEDVLAFDIPQIQKLEKIYFDEWTSTITDYDIASVPDQGGAEILRGMLKEYVLGKYKTGLQEDAQLFTGDGKLLKIGSRATIKPGMEQKPDHAGVTFTITDILPDNSVTLSSTDIDGIFGYGLKDLRCVGKTKEIAMA